MLSEVQWAIFEAVPDIYVGDDSNLVADTGNFGGAAARLKMVVAGANVTIDEGAASLTINAAAPGSTVAAGENVILAENLKSTASSSSRCLG